MKHVVLLPVLMAAWARAQDFGTADLPAALAAPGTKVEGVLNRNPGTNAYLGFCEGPAVDAEGNLYFSSSNRILKATPQGQGSVFIASAPGTNGLEFDFQGRLISGQSNQIARYSPDGSKETLAASGGGVTLGSVNDLSVASTGAMLFTNFDGGRVFYRSAAGGAPQSVPVANRPNGIEWVEEKNLAYLCVRDLDKVVKFELTPGGSLAGIAQASDFATDVGGPDGITLDEQGNVYVAANQLGLIKVYSPEGALLGKITVKSANPAKTGVTYNTTNCTFGGPGNKTLFIAGDAGGYKVQLLVAGRRRPFSTGLGDSRRGVIAVPRVRDGHAAYDLRGLRLAGRKAGSSRPPARIAVFLGPPRP